METIWKFIGACADGERFEIDGLNAWECEWVRDPGTVARVRDPHHDQSHEFDVYSLVLGSRSMRVAAGEFSNGIWGFYVPVPA